MWLKHVTIDIWSFTRSALRTSLTPEVGIRRIRRSTPNIDRALSEAAQVEKVCSAQFPYCKISRIDILRLYNIYFSKKRLHKCNVSILKKIVIKSLFVKLHYY